MPVLESGSSLPAWVSETRLLRIVIVAEECESQRAAGSDVVGMRVDVGFQRTSGFAELAGVEQGHAEVVVQARKSGIPLLCAAEIVRGCGKVVALPEQLRPGCYRRRQWLARRCGPLPGLLGLPVIRGRGAARFSMNVFLAQKVTRPPTERASAVSTVSECFCISATNAISRRLPPDDPLSGRLTSEQVVGARDLW